jgi:hypothetical protein
MDPYLEPVHADPRFAQLMARMKLPMPSRLAKQPEPRAK